MAFFTYKAKNEYGETVKGKVEAKNLSQASLALRSRQLLIISITPEVESAFAKLSTKLFSISNTDIVNFTRQLSTMVTAGLSLTEALSILSQQSKPAMETLIEDLQRDIEGGVTFAEALGKHERYFSRVYVQLVRAGEAAGVLDEMLQRLAENMEKDKEFRSKTQGALIYPAIVVVALLAVAAVMMIFVIPKLTEMYKDFGADLPVATQILIDISTFFVKSWWLIGLAIIGGIVFLRTWGKTPDGQRRLGALSLKIPMVGILRKKIILTEFARTLSLLLSAGISLLSALSISSNALPSILYRDALEDAAKQVEKGIPLAKTLADRDLFPPILMQMVAVGEETGKLDEVLLKLSLYFQSESEQAVKNLTTAIEPMIMIVLGIGVGLMVVAIIMPIYSLTSQF
jgi:type IV pilus assembly protein PilC